MRRKPVTLWHGTAPENVPSILEHGIMFSKSGLQKKLWEIRSTRASKESKKRAYSRAREATIYSKGGVYVSGSKLYAMQNALASREYRLYLGKKYEKIIGGQKAAIMRIKMPWKIFKSLLATEHDKMLIERYEELDKEGFWDRPEIKQTEKWGRDPIEGYDAFTLKEVPPKYIKSYRIFTKRRSPW